MSTPLDELQRIIAANEANDPDFYKDPDAPRWASSSNTTIRADQWRTPNEARESYFLRTGFQPSGSYGPDDSPVPLDLGYTEVR